MPAPLLERLAPALFVVLWSTGWIVARAAAPHAEPLAFLSARYAGAIAVLLPFALLVGAPWPQSRRDLVHGLVSGVLLHAVYLGGVWWGIRHGLPAAVSAVIAALQPALTVLLAPSLIGERIRPVQWLGVLLGSAGVLLVLAPKLAALAPGGSLFWPVAVNFAAMASVTLGTFYQKRFLQVGDLRTMTVVQYAGALAVTVPAAFALGDMRIAWNLTTVAVLAWSVLGLSIGAIALLLLLIRRGAVSRAASLVYLVPPAVALQAWLAFGEALSLVQLAGMAAAIAGVVLISRAARNPPRESAGQSS